MDELTISRPDDWHLHLRDGNMLRAVLPASARQFARAVVMPNLVDPVTTVHKARAYRGRILEAMPEGADFTPLMTCYLTDATDAGELAEGFDEGVFFAAKLYPAGATTHSAAGVTELGKIHDVLETMAEIGMPLLLHGEVTDPEIDIFDRELVFIDRVLVSLLADFTTLKVVLEHITTDRAVAFVRGFRDRQPDGAPLRLGATITAHHLVLDRNAMFEGGLRPHHYCLPVAKRAGHRQALRAAATSGEDCFFLGTDSAPHPVHLKEAACGCAGIFSAPAALPLYAQVFEDEGALDRFEAFAGLNGAAFYGLAANARKTTLIREAPEIAESIDDGDGGQINVFTGKGKLNWRLAGG